MEFSRRMKREGRIVLLRERALTSPRRWEAEGVLYGTLRNGVLLTLFFSGVSPFRLRRWYGNYR
ncbi:MAG: hypothetical protein HY760_06130 [Nitrospirae bacterium]|nr:hypothetical protein [Nitrospirota bacterium]